MNERIDELIEQCTSVNDDLVYNGRDSYMKTTEYFDKQKFAELIVRECANMAESFHRNQYDFTGNLELHEFIKQHFGVKE